MQVLTGELRALRMCRLGNPLEIILIADWKSASDMTIENESACNYLVDES